MTTWFSSLHVPLMSGVEARGV